MELLLEAFILFSCLMFWVVFFHKKGTLAKLKKIESSIQSKISILEDLASKYPQGADMAPSVPKMTEFKQEEQHESSGPLLNKEKVFSKVMDSANVFEQKIENMLRHYGALKAEEPSQEPQAQRAPQQIEIHASSSNEDEQLEQVLAADKSFQKQTQVAIPRTKPIESFQDVINLSKALEQEKTSHRS